MRPALVLWDWNGTLLDDAAYALAVRNRVFPRYGLPALPDMDAYRAQFTFPVREYYRRGGVTDAQFPAVARAWFDEYARGCADLTLAPYAEETLEAFAAVGCPQVVLSASEKRLLLEQMGRFGILHRFAAVLGLEGIEAASKESLARGYLARAGVEPGRCVLLGDTLHDADVAAAVGARCVLVARGHQGRDTLAKAGVPVADDLREAAKLILRQDC